MVFDYEGVGGGVADFPAVFFHICGFDICHETQNDKYKYQNHENKSQLSRAID